MTDNIPPEIADEGSATAPVRISPEVRETILRCLRIPKDEWQQRADNTPPACATCKEYKEIVADIDAAIAFVEALP